MPQAVPGVHHVTAIASDPGRNLAFYTETLGLRLVKRSVNQDDVDVYHLFYGDRSGSPGTSTTFFPHEGAHAGQVGTGQVSTTQFLIPGDAVEYWTDRLAEHEVDHDEPRERFEETVVALRDPDGLELELVARDDAPEGDPPEGPVPAEHAIRGFHGVTLCLTEASATTNLLEAMGYEERARSGDGDDRRSADESGDEGASERDEGSTSEHDEQSASEPDEERASEYGERSAGETDLPEFGERTSAADRTRYESDGELGYVVDVREDPQAPRGQPGAGTVHHVAFQIEREEQAAWRDLLQDHGLRPTQVIDRKWFESIYARTDGGVLFEFATKEPGYAVDEDLDSLGERLVLPAWLEGRREEIESELPPLDAPPAAE